MERVSITTVYKHIASLKPRRIALVTQKLRERIKREEGSDVVYRDLRNREEVFKSQLLQMGIQHVPFSEPELSTRIGEITKKREFDMCVITGEPFYQLLSIAAKLRQAHYSGPIYLEITEDEATKQPSLQAAQANAKRYKLEALLHNLVYLTKTIPREAPRELDFDISISPPEGFPSDVPQRDTPKRSPAREVSQPPTDIAEPPKRFKTQVSRVIRDTVTARALKSLYEFRCQVCGTRIEISPDTYYVEVHHVRPLGGGHKGLDKTFNMLVLCPNHHAMFDFRIPRFTACDRVEIDSVSYQLTTKHHLTDDVIEYHNTSLRKPVSSRSRRRAGAGRDQSGPRRGGVRRRTGDGSCLPTPVRSASRPALGVMPPPGAVSVPVPARRVPRPHRGWPKPSAALPATG